MRVDVLDAVEAIWSLFPDGDRDVAESELERAVSMGADVCKACNMRQESVFGNTGGNGNEPRVFDAWECVVASRTTRVLL